MVNAELQFEINETCPERIFVNNGNFRMLIPGSETLLLALKKPLIRISGNLNMTSWQGIFWYEDKAIMSHLIHSCVIRGDFSVEPLFNFGGILLEIMDVSSIESLEWYD